MYEIIKEERLVNCVLNRPIVLAKDCVSTRSVDCRVAAISKRWRLRVFSLNKCGVLSVNFSLCGLLNLN